MRINQNIYALTSYRYLTKTNEALGKSLERLSSGLRINRAADDAAGLAISEKMRSQIKGLAQAVRNAQDGISLIQTAEGGLNETHAILQRMRELAAQAASETTTNADRAEIQKEIAQLIGELDRIGNSTEFNTKKLLNGQAGASVSPENGRVGSDPIKVNGNPYAANASVSPDDLKAAVRVTAGTDTQAGVYTVQVQRTATAASIGYVAVSSDPGSGTLTINGYSLSIADSDTFETVATKINNISSQTGVEASYSAPSVTLDTNGAIVATGLSAYQGLAASGVQYRLFYDDDAAGDKVELQKSTDGTNWSTVGFTSALLGQTVTVGSGNEWVTVTLRPDDPASDLYQSINVVGGGLTLTTSKVGSAATINISGGNDLLQSLGLVAASDDSTSVLSDAGTDAAGTINGQAAVGVGNTLTLKLAGNPANGLTVKLTGIDLDADNDGELSTLSFDAAVDVSGRVTLQIGANNSAEQRLDLDIGDMRAAALGVDNIDVTDAADARAAIEAIDAAISLVSSERAKLGAYQNRLEHTINNLSVAKENLTAAESRIRDLDISEEMMAYTRNQIISQAAMAMLAQANTMPSLVLKLLG